MMLKAFAYQNGLPPYGLA